MKMNLSEIVNSFANRSANRSAAYDAILERVGMKHRALAALNKHGAAELRV